MKTRFSSLSRSKEFLYAKCRRTLKLIQLATYLLLTASVLCFSTGLRTGHALSFNFFPEPGTPTEAIQGLEVGGDLWTALLTDNITIDVGFRFSQEPAGAASTLLDYSYTQFRDALTLDLTSASDATAVNNLQIGPTLSFFTNLTGDNPNGPGSPTPYLDNNASLNNTTIRMTASNAKGLGLARSEASRVDSFLGGNITLDAVIILDPFGVGSFPWDFDRTDGISAGSIDFSGIVAHEIGHVLGFSTGVDILDRNPGFQEDQLLWVNTLDLFRFSDDSFTFGSRIFDWTASTSDKYFSIDGGFTRLAGFSTGLVHGNGRFPGHWDLLGTGIMDSFLDPFTGTEANISNLDIEAIDIIGWEVVGASPIPEPSTLILLGTSLAGLVMWRLKTAQRN